MTTPRKPPSNKKPLAEYVCQRVGCGKTFFRNLKLMKPGTSLLYCPACEADLAAQAAKRRRPGSESIRGFHSVSTGHTRRRRSKYSSSNGGEH
jgi:hypothetical protein